MKKKKITLREEIVKYIFPTAYPSISQREDGFIVYNFLKLYPHHLGIFIPNEVDQSNYCSYFPKPFESFFINVQDEAAYLSRFLEANIEPTLKNSELECVSGVLLPYEKEERCFIFRFDECVSPVKKIDVLCRIKLSSLSAQEKLDILAFNPVFRGEAISLTGDQYVYWIMPVTQLFKINIEILAAIIAFANSFRTRNGPF